MNEQAKKRINELNRAEDYIKKLGFSILGWQMDTNKTFFGFNSYDKKSNSFPFGEIKGYIENVKGQPIKVIFEE